MTDPENTRRLPATLPHGEALVAEAGTGNYSCDLRLGPHHGMADEPADLGGQDAGPNPYEYLLAALGSCTGITLRMYANLKKLPLTRVVVQLKHRKVHVQDCADCAEHPERSVKIDEIERHITLEGALDAAQRQRLLAIADRCPVHQTLKSEIRIVTSLVESA
ncbi:OsmC family protein [Solimonas terrae]|uniref:OsmC family protein n=1 Tax=Solimonas terrae TaxID=1396819 RepID=A0A6M2BN35_9GAMM|nr:OsmC family protein [Solimonas terrae]NGY03848.1 OsmC family protein [Solimonas terrae]